MTDEFEHQHFQGVFGSKCSTNDERIQVLRNNMPERKNCPEAVCTTQKLHERDNMVNDFALTQCSP